MACPPITPPRAAARPAVSPPRAGAGPGRGAVGGGRVSVGRCATSPGLITACPARPDDAPAPLRTGLRGAAQAGAQTQQAIETTARDLPR
ncbi:MAG: hypothetical protein ACLQDY_24845 [Streptosporangiaceae bacterium]